MEKLRKVNTILVKNLEEIRGFLEENSESGFELFKTRNGFALSMYSCFEERNFESLAHREYDFISTANAQKAIKDAGIKIMDEEKKYLAFCEGGKLFIEELKFLDVIGDNGNMRFKPYDALKVPFYVNGTRSMNIKEIKDFKWKNFVKKVEEESAK